MISSPFVSELNTSAFIFPDGASIKGKGKDLLSIRPVFRTSSLCAKPIKEHTGASRPSFNSSSAEAASVSIKRVLFFLDDVIFFSFFP